MVQKLRNKIVNKGNTSDFSTIILSLSTMKPENKTETQGRRNKDQGPTFTQWQVWIKELINSFSISKMEVNKKRKLTIKQALTKINPKQTKHLATMELILSKAT